MAHKNNYVSWDFEDIWTIDTQEGQETIAYLKDLPKPISVTESYLKNKYNYTVIGKGSGTEIDPFIITTPQELESINNLITVQNAYFKLVNDIDNSRYLFNEGLLWLKVAIIEVTCG